MSVHTIWVPAGWSAEQVWEAIRRGEPIVPLEDDEAGVWVNVDDDGKVIK